MSANWRLQRRSAAIFLGAIGMAAFPLMRHASADEVAPLFMKNCAPCHGIDGKARTPVGRRLGVKDLTQSNATDEAIAIQILKGSQSKGNQLKMPSFEGKLSPEEVKWLVQYVRKLRPPGQAEFTQPRNKTPP